MENCPNCSARVESLPHGLVKCVDVLDVRISNVINDLEEVSTDLKNNYSSDDEIVELIKSYMDDNPVDEDGTKDELRSELHEFVEQSRDFPREVFDNRHFTKDLAQFIEDHLTTREGTPIPPTDQLEQMATDFATFSMQTAATIEALQKRIEELEGIVNGE